jgi:hypothetical protein
MRKSTKPSPTGRRILNLLYRRTDAQFWRGGDCLSSSQQEQLGYEREIAYHMAVPVTRGIIAQCFLGCFYLYILRH